MGSVIHKGTICRGCGDTVDAIYVNRFDRVDIRVSYNDVEGLCGYCLLLKKYYETKSRKSEKALQPKEQPKRSEAGEAKALSPTEGEPSRSLEAESKLKDANKQEAAASTEEFEEFQEAEGCHKAVRKLIEHEQRRFSAPHLHLGHLRQTTGVWPRHFVRRSTWRSC